jgi:hypothetical protein
VSFFRVSARAKSVVYVIDRSASMGLEGGLDAAKRELAVSLSGLDPGVRFQIVFYNRHAETVSMGESLLLATAENQRKALRFLDEVRAEGGTNHVAGLTCALNLRPETIYFLTDAGDLTDAQVAIVTRANRGRISIHTICMGALSRATVSGSLERLARENGGRCHWARLPDRP